MAEGILSVGIDIGTSTTQVIFSKLAVEDTSGYFSVPHVSIVDKRVVYKGEVHTTPLLSPELIDGDAVRSLVERDFALAGFSPADTGTGAVIITGETARKENAALVLEKLSGFAGDFVVSTAGPDLESIIAGKGSGAWGYSRENACAVVNLDIGGGTTNLAAFDSGETIGKGCLDIGGRLIRLEPDLTVAYLSPAAEKVARWRGAPVRAGERATLGALRAVCEGMAELLEQALGIGEADPLLRELQTPGSSWFMPEKPPRAVFFSGGVADAIYHPGGEPLRYGDIGVLLGEAVRHGRIGGHLRMVQPEETIRATVVGAGTYTTTISGSTITYSRELFPLKNIPVLKLSAREQAACLAGEARELRERIRWFLGQSGSERLAVALGGLPNPTYGQLKTLAGALAKAADAALAPGEPVLLVVECDIAKALGQAILAELQGRREVVAIDSVRVDENDYLDMGKPLMNGVAIPVVVKTLIFG